VIIAGHGAHRAGARDALEQLAVKIGALLITSLKAKDMFRGSPYNLGVIGSLSHSMARRYVEQADCIVVFGASLNFLTTSSGMALPDVPIIHVDSNRSSVGRWFTADVAVVGDANLVAQQLIDSLPDRDGTERPFHSEAVKLAIAEFDISRDFSPAHTPRTLDPRSLAIRLNELLPPNRNLIYDAGNFMMAATYLDVPSPSHFKISSDFASMGAGFGTALGFAKARPDEANVLIIGDGGFMMTLSELESVARNEIALVVIVMNDCAYGAELQICRLRNLPEVTSIFPDIDFAPIAEALGFETATIRTLDDLDRCRALLQECSGPILLDCKVNADVPAPFMAEYAEAEARKR
jgi:thiamine pyrophosphate-dependent acetolactate synthase large subunit-like protein